MTKFVGIDIGLDWWIMTSDGHGDKYSNLRRYPHRIRDAIDLIKYDIFCIEDLDIATMDSLSLLDKLNLSDVYELILKYSKNYILVPSYYSSQECNKCHYINNDNRFSRNGFRCLKCGFTEHADLNAAINIRDRGKLIYDAWIDGDQYIEILGRFVYVKKRIRLQGAPHVR